MLRYTLRTDRGVSISVEIDISEPGFRNPQECLRVSDKFANFRDDVSRILGIPARNWALEDDGAAPVSFEQPEKG